MKNTVIIVFLLITKVDAFCIGDSMFRKHFKIDTSYYQESNKVRYINYLDSNFVKIKTKYFFQNGTLHFEKNYDKYGKPEGISRSWYETGEKKSFSNCSNGDCEIIEYYKNGRAKLFYRADSSRKVVDFYFSFFEDGIMASTIQLDSGKVLKRTNYYRTGELKSVLTVTNYSSSEGEFRKYFESGAIKQKGRVTELKLDFNIITINSSKKKGVWYEYDTKGNVLIEEIWKDGEVIETVRHVPQN